MIITKTNASLSAVFDVDPTVHEVIEHEGNPVAVIEDSQNTDFEIARATMHNLLLKGQQAVENALVIANGTEDADSYNAVSNLIGKVTAASTKLMELHDIKMKLNVKVPTILPQESGVPAVNISGPVFCGTTSELSKMLADQRKSTNTTGV